MRVLKRDMPLTILVDILVQIVFVLSLLFALEILTGDQNAGLVDPQKFQAEIERLKREIAALEEENERLKAEIDQSSKQIAVLEKDNEIAQGQLRARVGERDCFRPGRAVVLVQWIDTNNVRVERGEEFDALQSSIPNSLSLLRTISLDTITVHFEIIRQYAASNNCLMFVRFQYRDATPKDEWMPAWRQVFAVFKRGRFEPI